MRIKTKNMRVPKVPLHTTFNKLKIPLVLGMFLISLSLVGSGGFALASTVIEPLQIHHERVTGSVNQLSLRRILDQFQEQLGIEYQAPKEELEHRVSVDLQGESVPQALAKILAPWDYALDIDPEGRVQKIFVVRKIPAEESEDNDRHSADNQSDSPNHSGVKKEPRVLMGEPQEDLRDQSHAESPTFGFSPPALQAGPPQQNEREFQDAMDAAGMGMIPPPDHPEMEMNRVSAAEEKTILQSLNPSTSGSSKGTGSQGMNLPPVSEEEAEKILRSLNQSIGYSREASPP